MDGIDPNYNEDSDFSYKPKSGSAVKDTMFSIRSDRKNNTRVNKTMLLKLIFSKTVVTTR